MRVQSYRWLLAVGLVAGGFKVYQSHPELHQWLRRHQFRVDGLDQALPSQVYFLETDRWLEFEVPKTSPLARLISNASISPEQEVNPGTQWPYAIEYELRGDQGRTIDIGTYHFKGRRLAFVDKQSGNPVEVNSYLERRFRPLGGRHCMLSLKDTVGTSGRVLRLRLHSSHPDLLEVAVRVYFRSTVPERKIGYLWNRLSDDQKRDLTRGNVYSFEGLTDRERYGLLRYRWAVAAPEGIPGQDFQRRTLYIRDDSERLTMLQNWVPAGIPVDAEHRAVLPMTNGPGIYQVEMVDSPSTSSAHVVSTTLSWVGQGQCLQTQQLTWSGTNRTVLPECQDGFLTVDSSRSAVVRAFQAQSGRTNEITPEPVQVLTFNTSPTNAVEYAVEHAGEIPTLFRIDVRRLPPPTDGAATANGIVKYALLAENGDTFQANEVVLTNTLSAYDWLVTTNGLTNISAPQSLCFVLPPAVAALRIASPYETVLVNGYSRPSQLVRRILVPEDYSPVRRLQPEQPSWFTVRPPDHLRRRESVQSSLVRVQMRSPEYDPLVQAGQYEWESFLPTGQSHGQMVVFPPAEGRPPRTDSIPFSYFPVEVGQDQRVLFQGEPWERQVAPSVLLVSASESPGSATVRIDGQTLLDNSLDAPVTRVGLGTRTVGEHALNIKVSGPVSAYVNYLDSASPATYLQRFCVMASSNVLHFPYVKRQTHEEVLVLRVFSPVESNPEPFDVRLKLKPGVPRGIGPFSELTLLEREARVTPNPVSRTRLVAATPSQLDDGQVVFFPVGPDLRPGQHELEVTVVTTSPRWVSLSRTTPGLAEHLELSSKRRAD